MRELHFTIGMSLHRTFAALWFGSCTAAAVLHGLGSVNDTGKIDLSAAERLRIFAC
jgi:hypothetical protein